MIIRSLLFTKVRTGKAITSWTWTTGKVVINNHTWYYRFASADLQYSVDYAVGKSNGTYEFANQTGFTSSIWSNGYNGYKREMVRGSKWCKKQD